MIDRWLAHDIAWEQCLEDLTTEAGAVVEEEFGEGTVAVLSSPLEDPYGYDYDWWPRLWLQNERTLDGDLRFLARQLAARGSLERYASVKRALQELAEIHGLSVHEEVVRAAQVGVFEASQDAWRARRQRRKPPWKGCRLLLGERVIRGQNIVLENRKGTLVRPIDYVPSNSIRWYAKNAQRFALAYVRELAWLPTEEATIGFPDLDRVVPLDDVMHTRLDEPVLERIDLAAGLESLLAGLDTVERCPVLSVMEDPVGALLETAVARADLSHAEQELLDAYLEIGNWPSAARRLGLRQGTMRQRKRRMLAKLSCAIRAEEARRLWMMASAQHPL